MHDPLGDRYELTFGETRAEVASVAAALLFLSVEGNALTETTPPGRMPAQGAGIVLAPWPNRVRNGRWEWKGEELQLDLTDPSVGGATHGLLRNTAYRVIERTDAVLELGAFVAPQHGWPFPLATRVRYEAEEDGIRVTHRVENLGDVPAPWAVGAHPYLRVGDTPVERLTLTVPAGVRAELDETLVPVRLDELHDTEADLSDGRLVEELQLNHPYGDLDRGPSGELAWLDSPDGARTTLWGDEAFRWLQLYTPRDHPRDEALGLGDTGLAIAVEPMTAPPNALATGDDLIELPAGGSWEGSWGIRLAMGD